MSLRNYLRVFIRSSLVAILLGGLSLSACAKNHSSCTTSAAALQILGSGGPVADDARASSAYLVWVQGKSRVLIDAGGGAFLRFAEAGANFADLDFIGISHFHADHSADLPALLKSGYFSNRERPLPVSGPAGGGGFPGLHEYLDGILSKDQGAYGYLSGYLDGSGGLPALEQVQVEMDQTKPATVLAEAEGLRIDALHVPHGIVPALAFRLHMGDSSIVFSSDQNGSNEQFIDFAHDADILVMHMPVPEEVTGVGRRLHAPPSVIGQIAAKARVKTLVLSHFMARSLRELDENVSIVREIFDGRILIASDLDCVAVHT